MQALLLALTLLAFIAVLCFCRRRRKPKTPVRMVAKLGIPVSQKER